MKNVLRKTMVSVCNLIGQFVFIRCIGGSWDQTICLCKEVILSALYNCVICAYISKITDLPNLFHPRG